MECVADSGYFGLVYYQLRSANSPFCHSKVRVGERNGEVRVKSGLDYEETEAFSCVIEALDHDLNMQPQHTSTAVLHVLLVDVNDNTPALKSAPLTFTGALHTTPSLSPSYSFQPIISPVDIFSPNLEQNLSI